MHSLDGSGEQLGCWARMDKRISDDYDHKDGKLDDDATTEEALAHSWVRHAWQYGVDVDDTCSNNSNFTRLVTRPLARLIYSVATAIILGLIGSIFHACAAGYYKYQGDKELTKDHATACLQDFSAFLSMFTGVGEAECLAYTFDARVGYLALTSSYCCCLGRDDPPLPPERQAVQDALCYDDPLALVQEWDANSPTPTLTPTLNRRHSTSSLRSVNLNDEA